MTSRLFILFLLFVLIFKTSTAFVGENCKSNTECMPSNHCDLTQNICIHNSIFPFELDTLFGLMCILFGSALSNAGGIGGGGLLIPILLLVLKFYTHEAIPISKLMIFSGAITSFMLGFKQKHPFRDAISIDYNIPMLLVPMVLFGTMVGVTLNKVTPPWIILVSLTLVLIINTYKTLKKGRSLYNDENKFISNRKSREIEILNQMRTNDKELEIRVTNYNENSNNGSINIVEGETYDKDNKFKSVEFSEKSTLQCNIIF